MSSSESEPFRKTLVRMEKIMDRSAGNPDLSTLFAMGKEVYRFFYNPLGPTRVRGAIGAFSGRVDLLYIDYEAGYRDLLGSELRKDLKAQLSAQTRRQLRQQIMQGGSGSLLRIDAYFRSQMEEEQEDQQADEGVIIRRFQTLHIRRYGARRTRYMLAVNNISDTWDDRSGIISSINNDDEGSGVVEVLTEAEIQDYCNMLVGAVRSRVEGRIRLLQ